MAAKPKPPERKKSAGALCGDCRELLTVEHPVPAYPHPLIVFICGHDDHSPLDSNAGGREIGFTSVRQDWCPLLTGATP